MKAICDNCDKEFDLQKQGFQGHGFSKHPNPARIKSWCKRKCYDDWIEERSWYKTKEGIEKIREILKPIIVG